MNPDEIKSISGQGATTVFAIATGAGVVTAAQAAQGASALVTIATSLSVIIPAICTLASICASAYRHWNMKKVPETAVVVPGNPAIIK